MVREFEYGTITINDIENNLHLIFICDGDSKKVKLESEKENNESN